MHCIFTEIIEIIFHNILITMSRHLSLMRCIFSLFCAKSSFADSSVGPFEGRQLLLSEGKVDYFGTAGIDDLLI